MLRFDTPWQTNWQPQLIGTLLFVVDDSRVLLINKKTGHGAGRVNGPGGKLQSGESVLECAVRETIEEVGLQAIAPQCRCEMRFVETNGLQWLGFAFVAYAFTGQPRESVEASPFWCEIGEIPYAAMWPDDEIWLPRILSEDFAQTNEPVPLVGNFLLQDDQLLAWQFENTRSVWQDVRIEDLERGA